jgi:protein-tyrosine phosphatase
MAGWAPNFSWLTETLALGGALPPEGAGEIVRAFRITGVVDLRDEACDELETLGRVEHLHLPTADLCAVSPDHLDAGVEFSRRHLNRGGRLLIHCQHGVGRAPTLALCVLVDQGHEPLAALELAKSRRPLVSPSPEQYEAWAAWMRRREPVPPVPDFDAFKAIAYRHLASA